MTSSSIEGTEASGARSDKVEAVRCRPGRRVLHKRGGEDENMPVDEVGTGVGYFDFALPYFRGEYLGTAFSSGDARATRFAGRGSEGEDSGSKAGRREGKADSADLLMPATGGRAVNALREGDSIALESLQEQDSSRVNDTD